MGGSKMKIAFPLFIAFLGYLVSVDTFFYTSSWTIAGAGLVGFVYKVMFMLIPAFVASWMIEIVIRRVVDYGRISK
jgi:hypothetical protein